ncbi:hypothetical protein [Rivularia sp. UHCC 0363]|uniref:hypothetical protein n=1 Tax=Rivularia sp. UHCC 0363 TaxID=3110244 RepID=UPI002B1FF67D|nr:hypothetical protein [Rivularia sp. UHCC 0363]MEA5595683.1 hypothetical protein [Rivularia sp. UHCC 0363]
MLSIQELSPAFIYIPTIEKWGRITGCCLVDGKFQLIYATENNKDFGTMDVETCKDLVKSFGVVPF